MKRLYTSIAIILSVILLDIFSHSIILREEKNISEIIDSITYHKEQKNTEAALSETEKLSEFWNESRKKLAPFVSDRNLDEISDSISRMGPLIDADSDETAAEAEYIKRKLLRTHTKDLPYIHNIF